MEGRGRRTLVWEKDQGVRRRGRHGGRVKEEGEGGRDLGVWKC